MNDTGNDKYLLTPGPLTTSLATKRAMLRDWGSRDPEFVAITKRIQNFLLAIAGVGGSHVAVPVQGSGTFGVEATLGTLIAPGQRTLVFGKRRIRQADRHDFGADRPRGFGAALSGRSASRSSGPGYSFA